MKYCPHCGCKLNLSAVSDEELQGLKNRLHQLELALRERMPDNHLFSLREASKRYGIPLNTMRFYASRRQIPVVKIGKRVYLRKGEFEKWLERQEVSLRRKVEKVWG